jgi:phenylalanyl-tRNA synthetase beta chain
MPAAMAARAHAELMMPVPPMKRTFTSHDGSAACLDLYAPLGYVCPGAMKASVRWLRALCPDLPDDAVVLSARFTAAGLEVEGMEAFGLAAESCVVASVVALRPHPSRSGLRLVTVHQGQTQQEVVCGAPNVPAPGGLVVFAPLGVELPAKGLKVERRAIGGVSSEGMLCSESELGLGDDAEGLLVLPDGVAAPGARLADALPFARDTVLDISLTPNRPDALGHLGLAREAAALFGLPFTAPAMGEGFDSGSGSDLESHVKVSIEDSARCPHYGAAVLLDVGVTRSSFASRWRLASLGVRAISNVVDVTNLVMLGFGHPMHAFDLDKVAGRRIVVRCARRDEALRTLDGVERLLSEDDLVICDGARPVALAGVIGGSETEITAATRNVLLECAYFDPPGIRRAARRHGVHTESSHRFERGVDWGDTRAALASAVSQVESAAGARAAGPARIFEARALPLRTVTLRHDRPAALLGAPVAPGEVADVLLRLGFSRSSAHADRDVWQVPTFRPDVSREADLVEEIGRVRGYDGIPATRPHVSSSRDAGPRQALARRAREAAVAMGLSEAMTHALVSARDLDAVGAPPAVVAILNPLTEDRSVMRTSLLPGLLQAIKHARRHGELNASLFTVGAVFLPSEDVLPEERLSFAAILAGERSSWLSPPRAVDVWDAKGIAEGLVSRMLGRETTLQVSSTSDRPRGLHPRGAAFVEVAGQRVGTLGPIHPALAEAFEIDQPACVVEVDLGRLDAIGMQPTRFAPLARFPASTRDLAVVVSADVAAGAVERAARHAAAEMAERVVLFDRFVGGSVPPHHVSLGLRVVYRAPDRTLTDAEVDTRHAQVVAAITAGFGATVRS